MGNDTEVTIKALTWIASPIVVAALVVAMLPLSFYEGWALTYVWKWFFVPLFHLPELSIWNAAGVALVVRHLHPHCDDKRKWKERLISWLVGPPLFLFCGFCIHWLAVR